jgi:hypothetical protein
MDWATAVLNTLFALGGIASSGFLAWGGWLTFRHSPGFVTEGQGRFEHKHRRRARTAPRFPPQEVPFV